MGPRQAPTRTPESLRSLEIIAAAEAPAAVLRALQSYIDAWPRERIESLQKVDGGWAPFDWNQRPLRVNGIQDVRRIRDAIHSQSGYLREAGITLTPELTELDEFFCVAIEKAESLGQISVQTRSPANREPAKPSHQYVLGKW